MSSNYIFHNFRLTDEEYAELYVKFNNLSKFASWELIRRNIRNNYTEELEDIEQDLMLSIIRAGVYYKRQTYIQSCLKLARRYANNDFTRGLIRTLRNLWKNRKRHGAHRQRFGELQEEILECLVQNIVPAEELPDKGKRLIVDDEFSNYLKSICWNQQKNIGKKITKERAIRSGMASISEHSFLGSEL